MYWCSYEQLRSHGFTFVITPDLFSKIYGDVHTYINDRMSGEKVKPMTKDLGGQIGARENEKNVEGLMKLQVTSAERGTSKSLGCLMLTISITSEVL